MENQQNLMDAIDPEYVDRLAVRKQEIDAGSGTRPGIAAALAIGSIPIALAALSREVYGQAALPTAVQGVLDFAYALEYFENEFYKAVLNSAAFATVRTKAAAVPGAVNTLTQIQKHEASHVATLAANGAKNAFNLTAASFDFTGGRSATGGGPLAAATTDLALLLLVAQTAEDTGVRAYKGQAGILLANTQPALLEAALRIHSVEARHAARIRRIRRSANPSLVNIRLSGTIRGGELQALGADATISSGVAASLAKSYTAGQNATTAPSESNTTQAGVGVGSYLGGDAGGEAFDEPLDRADVIAIVQPFFIPNIA